MIRGKSYFFSLAHYSFSKKKASIFLNQNELFKFVTVKNKSGYVN